MHRRATPPEYFADLSRRTHLDPDTFRNNHDNFTANSVAAGLVTLANQFTNEHDTYADELQDYVINGISSPLLDHPLARRTWQMAERSLELEKSARVVDCFTSAFCGDAEITLRKSIDIDSKTESPVIVIHEGKAVGLIKRFEDCDRTLYLTRGFKYTIEDDMRPFTVRDGAWYDLGKEVYDLQESTISFTELMDAATPHWSSSRGPIHPLFGRIATYAIPLSVRRQIPHSTLDTERSIRRSADTLLAKTALRRTVLY